MQPSRARARKPADGKGKALPPYETAQQLNGCVSAGG